MELLPWDRLSPTQQAAVRSLHIDDTQVEYAGTIERAIAATEADTAGDVAGLAMQVDGEIVGFVVMRRRAALGAWAAPEAAALTGMRVDRPHQGRGLGTQALHALADWVARHWPGCTHVALQVDDANATGRRAYERGGFTAASEPTAGRIGPVWLMTRPLTVDLT